ncbi:MAG: gliding motility-associated C-terminal domain-containing protein [Brumimicrobium sp.]|nr:gliding motility-associated C-terminal domain-containing protein [Brumimicrobium sp.]
MKNIFFSLLLIVLSSTLYSQLTTTFRINYNQGLMNLPGQTIEGLTPETYLIAGTNMSFLPIYGTILQLDADGNLMWAKRYLDNSIAFQLSDIKKDVPNSQYYACGGSSSSDAVFIKTDASGNLVASKRFGISEATGAYFNRIVKASDGGYVAVGYVTGYDPDGVGPEPKFNAQTYTDGDGNQQTESIYSPLIVKLDVNGNHVWHKVFRYYNNAAKTPPGHVIFNSASFADIVETADGYVAVGRYKVANYGSSTNSDGEDNTATDALVLKTDFNGNVTYHVQYDALNFSATQDSKSLYAINKTSAGTPIAVGTSKTDEWIVKFGATGNSFNSTFSQSFYISGLLSRHVFDAANIYEVSGTTDLAITGLYINMSSLIPSFGTYTHRINSTANTNVFAKSYSAGLISGILANGSLTQDNSFILCSTSMGMTGYDYHVIKTDPNGDVPLDACAPNNINPKSATISPTNPSPYYNSWSGTVKSQSISIVVSNISPTQSVQCRKIICTPPPAPTATVASQPGCGQTTGSVTVSGLPSSGTWTVTTYPGATTVTGSGTSTTISNLPPGTYTFTVTVAGCESNASNQVTINNPPVTPVANPSATPSSVCEGENVQLNAGSFSSYSWTGPGGFTSNVQNPVITNITSTGTYTLTVTANGCTSAPVTVTVTVNPKPAPPTASNQSFCASATVNDLTATGTGVQWYSSASGGTALSSGQALTTGTYWVSQTSGGCESDRVSINVTINSLPNVNISSQSNVTCNGDNDGSATVTATGGGSLSYSWSPSGGNGATASGLAPGTYTVTVTDGNTCQNTASVTITEPSVIALTTSSSTSDCSVNNGTATVSVTGGNGGNTYYWDDPSHQTTSTAIGLGAGTYNVVVTDSKNCSQTASIVVNNPNAPVISNVAVTNATCEDGTDGSIAITVTSGTPGYTYSWSPSGGTSASATNLASGTYTVTVTDNAGCSKDSTIAVSFNNPKPVVTASALTTTLCEGDDINLEANIVVGNNITYNWNGPGGFTSSDQNPTITGASTSASGTYTVTVTGDGSCSSDQSSVVVTVNTTPLEPTASSSQSFCGSASVSDLSASGSNIQWYSSASGGTPLAGSDALVDGDTYYATQSNGTCESNSTAVTVSIDASSDAGTISGDNSICEGESIQLTSDGDAGGTWSSSNNGTASVDGSGEVIGNDVGSTTISYTVSGSGVCPDVSAQFVVTVNPKPIISLAGSSSSVCEGDNIQLSGDVTNNVTNPDYSWTGPNGFTSSSQNPTIPDAFSSDGGTYTLIVTSAENCGSDNGTVEIIVNPIPVINNVDEYTLGGCAGNPLELEVTNPNSNYTYHWVFDNNEVHNGINYTLEPVTTLNAGTYYVYAQTDQNCEALAEIITVKVDNCGVEVVETFSPNGDGVNDFFNISNLDAYPNTEVWIYTRWGFEVYHSENYLNDWDGTSQSKLNVGKDILPEGTYYYMIKLGGGEGIPKSGETLKGFVYLKR